MLIIAGSITIKEALNKHLAKGIIDNLKVVIKIQTVWRVQRAKDIKRKFLIAKRWEAQRKELIKLYGNNRQKKKLLTSITKEQRDSAINAYYRGAKKKHIKDLNTWAKKTRELEKSELKSESISKIHIKETTRKSRFRHKSRETSERSQPKVQSSFKINSESVPKINFLLKKVKEEEEELKMVTPKSTTNSSRCPLVIKRETLSKSKFKFYPNKEELVNLILNAGALT